MEIFQAFGLDLKLLIANFVNFAILMFILYKLAYKPVLAFVHERRKKIEDGLKNAEEARKTLTEVELHKEQILSDARKEAQDILAQAKSRAEIQGKAALEASHQEAAAVLERAQEQVVHERESMLKEAQGQITSLVLSLASQLLGKKMDSEADKSFVEKALSELKPRSE